MIDKRRSCITTTLHTTEYTGRHSRLIHQFSHERTNGWCLLTWLKYHCISCIECRHPVPIWQVRRKVKGPDHGKDAKRSVRTFIRTRCGRRNLIVSNACTHAVFKRDSNLVCKQCCFLTRLSDCLAGLPRQECCDALRMTSSDRCPFAEHGCAIIGRSCTPCRKCCTSSRNSAGHCVGINGNSSNLYGWSRWIKGDDFSRGGHAPGSSAVTPTASPTDAPMASATAGAR